MLFTPTAGHDEGPIGLLMQRWRAWKSSRDSLAGLDSCGREEVARIARDLLLTTSELRALARKGADSASLLYRRIADLGLDREAIARSEPKTLREMQKRCSLCDSKRRCRHDLARGADPSAWHAYCPNDDVLSALAPDSGRRVRAAVLAAVPNEKSGKQACLLGVLFIILAGVVLLAGHDPGLRHNSAPVVAPPASAEASRTSAVSCLDSSCLDSPQLAALEELRTVQSQGWIASSPEELATLPEASLIAQAVHAGETATCTKQGGTTYYGLMVRDGCSKGGREAATLEGYNECRSMAGGGVCLLRQ